MKLMRRLFPAMMALVISCGEGTEKNDDNDLKLWYKQPAERWLESLPLGNGRLGAMVFGGVESEQLGLNISTLWSGASSETVDNPEAAGHLNQIRQLLFQGEYAKAQALCTKYLMGNKESYGTHLPMADLYVDFPHLVLESEGYLRQLDLETAIASVDYTFKEVRYRRECFASWPDKLIVLHLEADQPGQLEFIVSLDGGELPHKIAVNPDQDLEISGSARENKHSNGQCGVDYDGRVRIHSTNGKVETEDGKLKISGADHATLIIAANTTFNGLDPAEQCRQQLDGAMNLSYKELKERHIMDHRRLFNRVKLDLGSSSKSGLPTDQRLVALIEDADDPQLYTLFYQYARYLLIASSREDSPLPGNLQGIWNDNFACNMPWTCDFHLDINTQQNYWPAEPANLSECHEPLFRLIEGMVESGRITARKLYGSDGWVAHVFTNAWGYTSPGWGLGWGLHVTGGIWVASHLWYHYEYTGDREFLRERAYPVLKEAAIFFLDYMVEHPKYGWLVTGPSLSPENKFIAPDGNAYAETMGPVCDGVLVDELFSSVIAASEILGIDQELRKELIEARTKLPPLQIGKYGQLQEWLEDFEEAVPNHRHTSHLIALYPASQVAPGKTPELAHAARITIERRTGQPDWEDVEWSAGNMINFYARLGDSRKAYGKLHGLLTGDTDMNLLTFSRAGIAGANQNIFVLDGNTSGANGISEMLVQSFDGKIFLLPALPEVWSEGKISGICARGGFELDVAWKEGYLYSLSILSKLGRNLNLVYGDTEISMKTVSGKRYEINTNQLNTQK